MKWHEDRNIEQMKKNPALDIEKIRECRYLHEFDRYVPISPPLQERPTHNPTQLNTLANSYQKKREVQGPSWGYPTEGAYYRDASSTDPMLGVRIPLYAIHAEDDPVSFRRCGKKKRNVVVEKGGGRADADVKM